MDEWISKKDLLKETGISYGQLYRWKREQLIPDAWFEKRSAFTGQETYFPRALALERVRFILAHKDEYSLTQLKNLLTPSADSRAYVPEDIAAIPNARRSTLLYLAKTGCSSFNHGQALSILILSGYDAHCSPKDEDMVRMMEALIAWENDAQLYAGDHGLICVIGYAGRSLPMYIPCNDPPLLPSDAEILYSFPISDIARTYTKTLNQINNMR